MNGKIIALLRNATTKYRLIRFPRRRPHNGFVLKSLSHVIETGWRFNNLAGHLSYFFPSPAKPKVGSTKETCPFRSQNIFKPNRYCWVINPPVVHRITCLHTSPAYQDDIGWVGVEYRNTSETHLWICVHVSRKPSQFHALLILLALR